MSNAATEERTHEGNGRSNSWSDAPDAQEIEERAYQLWVERGCPIGSPDEDWFRAEEELTKTA